MLIWDPIATGHLDFRATGRRFRAVSRPSSRHLEEFRARSRESSSGQHQDQEEAPRHDVAPVTRVPEGLRDVMVLGAWTNSQQRRETIDHAKRGSMPELVHLRSARDEQARDVPARVTV